MYTYLEYFTASKPLACIHAKSFVVYRKGRKQRTDTGRGPLASWIRYGYKAATLLKKNAMSFSFVVYIKLLTYAPT
jgi:hypothetical protein